MALSDETRGPRAIAIASCHETRVRTRDIRSPSPSVARMRRGADRSRADPPWSPHAREMSSPERRSAGLVVWSPGTPPFDFGWREIVDRPRPTERHGPPSHQAWRPITRNRRRPRPFFPIVNIEPLAAVARPTLGREALGGTIRPGSRNPWRWTSNSRFVNAQERPDVEGMRDFITPVVPIRQDLRKSSNQNGGECRWLLNGGDRIATPPPSCEAKSRKGMASSGLRTLRACGRPPCAVRIRELWAFRLRTKVQYWPRFGATAVSVGPSPEGPTASPWRTHPCYEVDSPPPWA